ncbi:hypothetical protein ACU686_31100 [Yinghuangia aomiensis]
MVPLLGVLPGTGGLTRVVDKRGAQGDLADVFATKADGVRGKTAVAWKLVDRTVPRSRFAEAVAARRRSRRGVAAGGIGPHRGRPADAVAAHRTRRRLRLHPRRRGHRPHRTHGHPHRRRADRPRAAGRRGGTARRRRLLAARDDARTRRRHPALADQRERRGHLVLKTAGDADAVAEYDAFLARTPTTGSSTRSATSSSAPSSASTSPAGRSSP